LLTVHVLTKMN